MISIHAVSSASDYKQFVNFPFELYQGNKFWVPPLKKDELKQLKAETNPAFEFCDAKFWTAWDNKKCVGRIGAIINKTYNEKIGRKMGRFTRVEFVDDKNVSKLLLKTAEDWLIEKGVEAIHGPLGFTNFDNQGLLIEGFDYLPSVASVMHMPYYKEHIEALGYDKENDWVEFRLKIEEVPEKATRLAEIIKQRNNLEVVHPKTTKDLSLILKDVFVLMEKSFDELPYVAKFPKHVVEFYAEKYFKILKPQYVKVIKKENEIVGFIVGLPSLSKAMQKANGKLFPFGFYHILHAMNHPEEMDLLLTGVDPHYQKMGLPAILINELQNAMIDNGVKYVETTGMFESNLKGATHWKNYDHIQHKRRRCFVKGVKA
jgi:ribosomal protein S18 acetylase RimI-like enzyme